MAELIHVDERKWPDLEHWQFDARRLGDDEHGTWLYVPRATVARRGRERPRQLATGFVLCVPAHAWWLAEFYWDHPWHEVYVNIGTPPTWGTGRVRQVDLDLDVVRRVDGTVEILDEDEFQEHQFELEYPPEVIDGARTATDLAVRMLRRGDEPFGGASAHWIRIAGQGLRAGH